MVAVTTEPTIIGSSTSPEFVDLPPSTPWMKIGMYTEATMNAAPLNIAIAMLVAIQSVLEHAERDNRLVDDASR